jgi:small subunit ribosomal protein S1
MSWTRRINHPSEVVAIGDTVEVVVLGINTEKQEISLGMKQTEVNPWMQVEQKYPPGTIVKGRVRNMTNYGAFIEIEEGIDGLLHISDMSWTKKIKHPSEIMKKGDKIEAIVLSVDQEKKRVALGLKQLTEDPWETSIPDRYKSGMLVTGVATKFTNFGVFIELDEGLEGLLHISELADRKVESPEEVVAPGERLRLMVIRVDAKERKIGLSLRRVSEADLLNEPAPPAPPEAPADTQPPAPEQPPAAEEPPVPEQPPAPEQPPVPEQPPAPEQPPVPEQALAAEEPPAPEQPPAPEPPPAPQAPETPGDQPQP